MPIDAFIEPAVSRDDMAIAAMEAEFFPLEALAARHVGYYRRRDRALVLVARDGSGAVLGYLVGTIQRRGAESTFWIVTMAVARSARRQGLGLRLLVAAKRWAGRQGIGQIKLQVGVRNRRAKALYERSGFEVIQRLPDYYDAGRDAYLMERPTRAHAAGRRSRKAG